MTKQETKRVVITRIYFDENGDLVVTDLWKEVAEKLKAKGLRPSDEKCESL